ncbi:MAG: hypothetical protein Ct9H300mP13_8620 [Gammaproteobacteria bacterium]|nr:MAG: hypothetical protein Ct9H300mP13_8620 [Gammaproteobacteria bacterium]
MFHTVGTVQGVSKKGSTATKAAGVLHTEQGVYETDLERGFVRGYNMQINRGAGPLNTA